MSAAGPAGSSVHADADTRLGLARVLLRLGMGLGLGAMPIMGAVAVVSVPLLPFVAWPPSGQHRVVLAALTAFWGVLCLALRGLPPRDRRWVVFGLVPWGVFCVHLAVTGPRA